MKEYYNDGKGIVILHGDSEEIVRSLPPPELIICDPPYGMDYQSGWRTKHQQMDKIANDKKFPAWVLELKPSVGMFLCCRWDNLYEIPKPKSFIVWDKMRHGMGDLEHEFGRQWEGIAFYPGPQHKFDGRPVDLIRTASTPPHKLVHPNEKPPQLFTSLIMSHKGNILDPFCGTGSVLRCAKDLGRTATGIEIEEKYCELAAERLRQEVLL